MERKKAIPATIAAGCDMILFNTSFEEDYQYLLDGIKEGILAEERLDDAVRRVLALKQWIGQRKGEVSPVPIEKWQKECADKAVTLVKNKEGALPLSPEKTPEIELILLGNPECPDGNIGEIAKELLEKRGFRTKLFDIGSVEMDGPGRLKKDKLVLYLANCEERSDQTAVRLFWSEKMALDMPRYVNEETIVFVSFANPYHLQDVPRIKTYINAYTASRATIEAVIEKLSGESEFQGVSPVDAFCGLFDTRM